MPKKILEDGLRNFAPYALTNLSSKGRRYSENTHPFRTDFQRDISRIIHCRPFRRLEYKTQVFLNGSGDHYRTRLTHTIEVSATARTIARTLHLNEDLTEAISLAHDLGHTPFGHSGEKILNQLLNKYGLNFDHNSHSLRIVDKLVEKYPDFNGLNLTWETRCGLLKHRYKNQTLDNVVLPVNLSLEAQVANIADDLTYYGHDIDDGIDSNLISKEELNQLSIWRDVINSIKSSNICQTSEQFIPFAIRCLINLMVTDVISNSENLLLEFNIKNPEQAPQLVETIIDFSPSIKKKTIELKKFLYDHLYNNKTVKKINNKAGQVISDLFKLYIDKPEYMGNSAINRLEHDKPYIVVADYIAGMTDRFAFSEHHKFFTHTM